MVTPDAVLAPGTADRVTAARAAVDAAGTALTTAEIGTLEILLAKHVTFGDAVRTLAAEILGSQGKPSVPPSDWSGTRSLVFSGKIGSATLGGRSEASVQRSVKIAMWARGERELASYRKTRGEVLARASKPDATPKQREIAKHAAWASEGIASIVAWADAKNDSPSRLNARTGEITRGGNRTSKPENVARVRTIEEVTADATTIADTTVDAETRELAHASLIVPGFTMGMLTPLTDADLRTLAAACNAILAVRTKTKTHVGTKPVPPVLETTAPVPPLDAVSPETADALQRLIDRGILTVTA